MKCPGQDTQYWNPDAIFEANCPKCEAPVEFFKDDTTRKCGKCGHRFINPNMDFGCATYCRYAEQCIGNLPPELLARKQDLLKDRVAIEMKRYFKTDFKRIGHAGRVARYAERIGKAEKGSMAIILAAAYLHDIGMIEAENKHGSAAPQYHEAEGSPVARVILEKLGAPAEMVDEICDIIEHHHHPRSKDSLNFKIVFDADLLESLNEKQKTEPDDPEKLEEIIESGFMTAAGIAAAKDVLFK